MKTQISVLAALIIGQFAQSTSVLGAELGMTAPPLHIAEWVKGSPVNLAAGKGSKIYVVEFWATWCPPCRESIPHLSELQSRHAKDGVTIIGITDEDLKTVKPFVLKQGEQMDYTVAIDRDRQTAAAYMKAFEIEGIPHAFVINRAGQVAWQGHPMDGLEAALKKIVAGTYDIEHAKLEIKLHDQVHEYLHLAMDGDSPLTRAAGQQLVSEGAKHPDLLNELAWAILTEEGIKQKDLALAAKAAKAAFEGTDGKDPNIMDTYALALFETGKKSEALAMQQQAIKLCKDPELVADMETRLERYQQPAK